MKFHNKHSWFLILRLALLPLLLTWETCALQVSERLIYKGFRSDGYALQLFHQSGIDFDDAVMVVTGPQSSALVRKKGKKFGMWVNTESRFIHYYYSILHMYTTRELREVTSEYNIKLLNLDFFEPSDDHELYQIFLYHQFLNDFYLIQDSAFAIENDIIFKEILLPSQIPVGVYKVHLYLFKNQNVVYTAQTEFEVKNDTIFYQINRAAYKYPLSYAFIAILIALAFGWKAAFFFRKKMR